MGPSFSWLGRQIVNLEVAGSNPVGAAIFSCVRLTPLVELGVLSRRLRNNAVDMPKFRVRMGGITAVHRAGN